MRIALLEDDADQAAVVSAWLQSAGHTIKHFSSGRSFLRDVLRDSYDLLVMDWVVPDMDGVEVMRRVRQSSRNYTPVLFVTARDQEDDVVKALGAGADDYMEKPLRQREFLARVNALVRRSAAGVGSDDLPDSSPYEIKTQQKRLVLRGEEIDLTHREFDLAIFMFRNAGRVVSRSHILESIWGMHGADLNTRTVDTHISRLRKKLKIGPANGWQLSAIYQHGYRLERTDTIEA
ncbi:MAG: response regulator transcription factor [Gammaproteobacteria bacterium]|nr:response regulator transcription factor [Gammaproteobacteria bacterium]